MKDARSAIRHYCNYRERNHAEVRNKLYELGCRREEVEQIISELISDSLLSEERYAKAYARGKFRMKQWGVEKIKRQLQSSKISEYCIKKALKEIDGNEYEATIKKLAERKWEQLKGEKNQRVKAAKVYRYLLQKGYETKNITEIINEIIKQA